MKIKLIKWKNFASYGNRWQELKFNDNNSFNYLYGNNGTGKCLHPDTEIEIEFLDEKLKNEFIEFIEKT